MSTEVVVGVSGSLVLTVLGWLLQRTIKAADDRLNKLEALVDYLRREQLDDTRILKEVGRNEGSITKLHERVDDLSTRVIKLEVTQT